MTFNIKAELIFKQLEEEKITHEEALTEIKNTHIFYRNLDREMGAKKIDDDEFDFLGSSGWENEI